MNMDPSLIQSMLQMGGQNETPQMQQLKRQQRIADMLRSQAMQPMEAKQIGRVSSAPGIANMAAQLYSAYKGNQMQQGIDQGMQQQHTQQMDTKKQYLDAMMMALRRQPPQASMGMMAPDGMEDR